MMPNPSSIPGIDALWPLCLDIVAQRRGHAALQQRDADSPLAWDASQGFALRGVWDDGAVELFDLLKPLLDRPRQSKPWLIGQLGQSLDGCVATHGGDSNYVNGPEVLVHLHRLRALSDAVIVGAGTAAIDDPQLTTRHVAGAHPVRVLLDPELSLSPTLRVFTAALEARGLRVLFVEGGGVTVSRFIAQGCLDRLHLSVAPVIIGAGRPGLQLPRSAAMRDCMRPSGRTFRMGVDVLWDLDLRVEQPAAPRS